ncbi:MAG: biliverdin-producing heme oxygenase [Planctomycetota bacterium]
MTARDAIRARIGPIHERLEELPFAEALARGEVSREDYARLLTQLAHVHEALERLAPPPALGALHQACARAAHLRADLARLAAAPQPVLESTRELVESLDAAAAEAPALAGWLYVVAGSRLGAAALRAPLARALGVEPEPGQGLDYHVVGAESFPRRWLALAATVDEVLTGPEDLLRCAEAADDAMHRFYAVYDGLGRHR